MKKLLAAWAMLLVGLGCALHGPAQAAAYYVSDCKSGAVAGCKAGSDTSRTPTNPATPLRTLDKAFELFRSAEPGDQILFARGSALEFGVDTTIQNTKSKPSNPIVFGAYQPSWYSGTQKPIIRATAAITIFNFSDGGTPEPDGGYIVRDLMLVGNMHLGFRSQGFFLNQGTHDVLIQNVTLDDFNIAVYCGYNTPRVALRRSTLINNPGTGLLWGCDDSVIEDNVFDNNGFGHQFLNHQIYFDSGDAPVKNIVMRGNMLTNSVHWEGNRCTGVPVVGHGRFENVLIENNRIVETTPGLDGCWGIAFDSGKGPDDGGAEYFRNITVRSNLLVNMGNVGIGCQSCQDWLIENNVLIWQGPMDDVRAIGIPSKAFNPDSEDLPTTRVAIRSNSIYFQQPGPGAIGIGVTDEGTGHVISSNLIDFGTSTHQPSCFSTRNRSINNFKLLANNLCWSPDGARFNQDYATQALAQAADERWNTDGPVANPRLQQTPAQSNGWSMAVRPTSPAIDAGHVRTCSRTAYGGAKRAGACDIGAYEHVAD